MDEWVVAASIRHIAGCVVQDYVEMRFLVAYLFGEGMPIDHVRGERREHGDHVAQRLDT